MSKEKPDVIGLSIGTQMELMAGLTFCKMIKESFPNIHVVVGGKSSRDCRKSGRATSGSSQRFSIRRFFTKANMPCSGYSMTRRPADNEFGAQPDAPGETGVHLNQEIYTEKTTALPLPDFDGLPLDHYFVPERIIPYLATRGCYWGRCTISTMGRVTSINMADVGESGRRADHGIARQISCRHFLFSDESYRPALFKKVSQLLVDQTTPINWTTLIRFEETLQDLSVWELAAKSGCCTLYYGMESANERVLNLMDKHARKSGIENNLRQAAKAGIWNHVMAFYGFPARRATRRWKSGSSSSRISPTSIRWKFSTSSPTGIRRW